MKKILSLLLALAMLLSLAACASESADTPDDKPTIPTLDPSVLSGSEKPDAESTDPSEEKPTEPLVLDELVTDASSEHLVYDDEAGNHYDLELSIPQINIKGIDTKRINSRIESFLSERVNSAVEACQNATSAEVTGVSYEHWLDDEDRMTLVVQVESAWDSVEYQAYTVDARTGKELNLVSIGKVLGLSGDEMKAALTDTISAYFDSLYSGLKADDPELYNALLEDTISIQNINNAQVYIDLDGVATVICDIYSPAGASKYQHVFPLVYGSEG